jgi:hypothetical protein
VAAGARSHPGVIDVPTSRRESFDRPCRVLDRVPWSSAGCVCGCAGV